MAIKVSNIAKIETATALERSSRRLWLVLVALTIAAVAELLVWRTFSRIGVFIPKDEPRLSGFRTFYNISVQIGTVMLNFAVLLAVLGLGLMVLQLRESGQLARSQNRGLTIGVIAAALVLGLSVALLYLVEDVTAATLLRLSLIVAFAGFGLDYWQHNRNWQGRLFISLLTWAYIIAIASKLMHDLAPRLGLDWQTWLYQPMAEAGELLVLINGFVVFLTYGTSRKVTSPAREMLRHWPALLGAIVIVGVFLGLTFLTVAESYIVPILGLYSLGYLMHWPLPLYAIALFFLAYTVFYNLGEIRRGPGQKVAALGLILVFCGGYIFNISDQYLFALAGVLLLTRPEVIK